MLKVVILRINLDDLLFHISTWRGRGASECKKWGRFTWRGGPPPNLPLFRSGSAVAMPIHLERRDLSGDGRGQPAGDIGTLGLVALLVHHAALAPERHQVVASVGDERLERGHAIADHRLDALQQRLQPPAALR